VIFHLGIKFFPRYTATRTPCNNSAFSKCCSISSKHMIPCQKMLLTIKPWEFISFLNLKAFCYVTHTRHANCPLVLHPDNIPYAGKSLMVRISAIFIWNVCPVEISNVSIPISHNCFNSSIRDFKYSSILFLGFFRPGITQVRNKIVWSYTFQGEGYKV